MAETTTQSHLYTWFQYIFIVQGLPMQVYDAVIHIMMCVFIQGAIILFFGYGSHDVVDINRHARWQAEAIVDRLHCLETNGRTQVGS